MNKGDLVDAISKVARIKDTKIAKKDINNLVDAFIETVTDALNKGEAVTLIGFGTFSTVKRAERVGRNPKTGQVIKIAPTVTTKFKAGKTLKNLVKSNSKKK